MTETPNPHIVDADTLTGEMHPIRRCVLAIGSNLGERLNNLQGAVSSLLDTPEFIWEYPELEHYYLALSRYLEIAPRATVLKNRLEVIQELLEMMADEQKHSHSSMLEWIIIILIAIEIALFFIK